MVTAAAQKMPDAVVAQLDKHGRMIIPIGGEGMQDLMLITTDGKRNIKIKYMGKVTFVEMKGKYGWTAN
jgi:protein-L-isoaspartate(D-aspartate) O-methyltransferase